MAIKMTHSGSLGMQHSITVSDDVLEHVIGIYKNGRDTIFRKENENDLLDRGMINLNKAKSLIDKEADAAYNRLKTDLMQRGNKELKDAINQWKTRMKTKAEEFFHDQKHGALNNLAGDGLPAMIDSLEGKKVKTKYTVDDAVKINLSIKYK